jgi:hypothetical protein
VHVQHLRHRLHRRRSMPDNAHALPASDLRHQLLRCWSMSVPSRDLHAFLHPCHAVSHAWSTAMSVSDRGDMRAGLHGDCLHARWAARASSYGRALSRRHCSGYRADRLHAGLLHHWLSDATRLGLLVASHAVLSGGYRADRLHAGLLHHWLSDATRLGLPVAAHSLLPCFPVLSSGESGMLTGVWPRPAGTRRSGGDGEGGKRRVQSGVHWFHVQYARTSLHAVLPSVI